jgi:hypothetical protein
MSDVRVKVTAQNETRTGFQQALGDARKFGQEARKSIGGGLGGIGSEIRSSLVGALAGIGIGQFVRSTFEQFGRINDLSQQFGVSAETLQRFGQVASESGSNIEQVAVALSTLTRNVQAAKDGTGEQAEALQRLGLSAQQLGNIDASQGLLKLADAYVASGDKQRAYADVLTIIGARQRNLIPLLQQGSAAILEQASQMSVASDEIIAKADEVGDRFSRLGQQLTVSIGPALIPISQAFLTLFEFIKTGAQQAGGALTSALLASGEVLKGNFAGAGQILKGEVDAFNQRALDLQKTTSDIFSQPATKPPSMLPPEDMDSAGAGPTKEKQKSDSDARKLEQEAARAAEDQARIAKQRRDIDLNIAELDAKLRGDATAQEDIAQQQDFNRIIDQGGSFEQAANFAATQAALRAQQEQQTEATPGMTGSFGASQLQRIGFASNEFFDTRRKEDPTKVMERMLSEQKKTNQILGAGEPLVLPASN